MTPRFAYLFYIDKKREFTGQDLMELLLHSWFKREAEIEFAKVSRVEDLKPAGRLSGSLLPVSVHRARKKQEGRRKTRRSRTHARIFNGTTNDRAIHESVSLYLANVCP